MAKIALNKPLLVCLYGYPGSGKSYVARNLADALQIATVSADRLRHELFAHPRYDAQENAIITHLMDYMCEEILRAGVSVIYDNNASRVSQRRKLREVAHRHKAEYLLVWAQIDPEHAFERTARGGRRTNDDKFSAQDAKSTFDQQIAQMQNPQPQESYMVISGKHSFITQKNAILSRLYQLGLIGSETVRSYIAKPELVNLVPNPHLGEIDLSRRNISIT